MYRFFHFSVISVVVALAPLLAHAGDAHWRVVETSGQVEVSSASGFMPASVSNDVNPGSVLRTGTNGRAVIENNGDRITVAPNSVFELPKQNAGAMEQVKQSVGTALYDMVPRGIDRFRVETPYLAALIKGTVFTVAVTPKGAAVEVLRGVVQVTDSANQSPTLVYPGQTATVAASEHGEVHLLGKPPASAPKDNAPTPQAQPSGSKSTAAAGDETGTHHDEKIAGGLHIEHTIAPKTVAIGDLTNGLITHVDVDRHANGGNGQGNGNRPDGSPTQTASLTEGFSSGGGDLSGFGTASGSGLGNVSLGVGNGGLSSGSNAGGNGNGNGNALGLGNGMSGGLGSGLASSGVALNPAGVVNPGNGIGNGGIPTGLVNNPGSGGGISPGNNAGGNGNGGVGNGNGKGNQKH